MAGSLSPAYIKLRYHSTLAPHTMTIPTLDWNDVPSAGNCGTFDTWDAAGVDAFDMVEGLATLLLGYWNAFVTVDGFVIYTLPVDPGPAYPVAAANFVDFDGTNPSTTWWPAVQTTLIARTDVFSLSKLVMLDTPGGDDYNAEITPSALATSVMSYWGSPTMGFSGRVNGRPNTYVKATQTLNEKLRKAYRYT